MGSDVNETADVVYAPSEDTFLLIDAIENSNIMGCCRALDVGCGSGAVTETLLKVSDEVVAVDLQVSALKATRGRVRTELHRVHLIASDRVAFLRTQARIELIACNPPYLPIEPDERFDPNIHAGLRGTEFSEELMKSLVEILGGRRWVLLLVTSSLADYESLFRLSEDLGFFIEVAGKQKLFFEEIFCLRLRPLTRRSTHERPANVFYPLRHRLLNTNGIGRTEVNKKGPTDGVP
ncbi:MAG: methyltransferase [Thaumarchaeota archaeon]|nr:methyltransferase [Candidatus Calditenuaceae archaeon]MDW8187103.1 methyltransferase [Nitrososphaerota archaeon]